MINGPIARQAAQIFDLHLIRTEWVGTDGLVWTWQDATNVLDTRRQTWPTKREAIEWMITELDHDATEF